MRVIGTGWRYWGTSEQAVDDMFEFMDGLLDLVLRTTDPVLQLVLGGGDDEDIYKQGADRLLMEWALANEDLHGSDTIPLPYLFPADWKQYGKAAGPLRNAAMITAGADLVVGFRHPDSRGTKDCLEKARRAKIPRMVVSWRVDKDPVEQPNLEVVRGLSLPTRSEVLPEAA